MNPIFYLLLLNELQPKNQQQDSGLLAGGLFANLLNGKLDLPIFNMNQEKGRLEINEDTIVQKVFEMVMDKLEVEGYTLVKKEEAIKAE